MVILSCNCEATQPRRTNNIDGSATLSAIFLSWEHININLQSFHLSAIDYIKKIPRRFWHHTYSAAGKGTGIIQVTFVTGGMHRLINTTTDLRDN